MLDAEHPRAIQVSPSIWFAFQYKCEKGTRRKRKMQRKSKRRLDKRQKEEWEPKGKKEKVMRQVKGMLLAKSILLGKGKRKVLDEIGYEMERKKEEEREKRECIL